MKHRGAWTERHAEQWEKKEENCTMQSTQHCRRKVARKQNIKHCRTEFANGRGAAQEYKKEKENYTKPLTLGLRCQQAGSRRGFSL